MTAPSSFVRDAPEPQPSELEAGGSITTAELRTLVIRFAEAEARMNRRVLNAITLSEQAVLNVGDTVGDIVRHARDHVEASMQLASRFGKDSEICRAIAQHSEDMRAFVEKITARLKDQRERAAELNEQIERIASAGERIRAIAREAKIVTVNARIEAVRLGPAGKPFAVIAEQLAQLTDDVGVANRIIGELAQTMSEVMPQIAENSARLVVEAEAFGEDFTHTLARLEQTQADLNQDVCLAVEEGERRSHRILQGSQSALSELQFQDPMAQSLREIPRISEATRRLFVEACGVDLDEVAVNEDGETFRAGELVARLTECAEVSLWESDVTGDDAVAGEIPDSGDVLLF